jgi:ribosome biogenesis ATPase
MKPAKLLHHVKLLVASLSIANSNDTNLDLVIKTLCTNYKEYNLEPTGPLRKAVSKALASVVETMNVQLSSKVMSLNQMVSNQYRNASSKRQRPAESDEVLGDPDCEDAIAVDDVNQVRISALHRRSSSDSSDIAAVSADIQLKVTEASGSSNNERIVESTTNGVANATSSSSEPSSSRKKSKRRGSSLKNENNKSDVSDESNGKKDVESDIVKAIMSKNRHGPPEFVIPRPNTRLSDMAGIDSITSQVRELVFYPVLYPGLYNYLGVQPPCGLLLHGPSGCGKTSLAYAIAGELGLPFFKASGPELIGGTSGESEERIRNIFMAAAAKAPSVLFIDALDVIAGKKTDRGMDRRIVAQLFDSIDSLIKLGEENLTSTGSDNSNENGEGDCNVGFVKSKQGLVVLIAATNKADSLDAGVRGRFSRELSLPVPDASSRTKILGLMTARMKLAIDVDLKELGRLTPGFVGADLKALAREAGMLAVSRIVDINKDDKEFLNRSHGNGSSSSRSVFRIAI